MSYRAANGVKKKFLLYHYITPRETWKKELEVVCFIDEGLGDKSKSGGQSLGALAGHKHQPAEDDDG